MTTTDETEKWIDIINEWRKDFPYPPIRLMVEKIIKFKTEAVNEAKKEIREEVIDEIRDFVNKNQQERSEDWNHKSLMNLWNYLGELKLK